MFELPTPAIIPGWTTQLKPKRARAFLIRKKWLRGKAVLFMERGQELGVWHL